VLALAGPEEHLEPGLLEALARAEDQGAVVLAVRIAADLVRSCGPAHEPRLRAAVAQVRAGTDHPDLAAARALLDSA
jgi:hypothetical protein